MFDLLEGVVLPETVSSMDCTSICGIQNIVCVSLIYKNIELFWSSMDG